MALSSTSEQLPPSMMVNLIYLSPIIGFAKASQYAGAAPRPSRPRASSPSMLRVAPSTMTRSRGWKLWLADCLPRGGVCGYGSVYNHPHARQVRKKAEGKECEGCLEYCVCPDTLSDMAAKTKHQCAKVAVTWLRVEALRDDARTAAGL